MYVCVCVWGGGGGGVSGQSQIKDVHGRSSMHRMPASEQKLCERQNPSAHRSFTDFFSHCNKYSLVQQRLCPEPQESETERGLECLCRIKTQGS